MDVEAASRAVRDEVGELALEVRLHVQELEPEHLCADRDGMRAAAGRCRLVDKLAGLRGLLGDRPDGSLEEVALSVCHGSMLVDHYRTWGGGLTIDRSQVQVLPAPLASVTKTQMVATARTMGRRTVVGLPSGSAVSSG